VNFILRISNYGRGGGGVEVEHLRVIAQLFLSSDVFSVFLDNSGSVKMTLF